jgi:hypothetical protein
MPASQAGRRGFESRPPLSKRDNEKERKMTLGAQASCLLVFESERIPKASRQDACAPSVIFRSFSLSLSFSQALRGNIFDQIAHPARITPFIVIPGKYFDHIAADNLGVVGIYNR